MIKKINLFLLFYVLTAASVFAQRVSEQAALEKARQFMQDKKILTNGKKLLRAKAVDQAPHHFYLFNAEDNDGFVIVSADERTPSILGYSNQRSIDTNHIPCNVKWLLNYYDASIAQLGMAPTNTTASTLDIKADIPTLIETQWGQGVPYNALCPMQDGERCLTGCVATAMAQVINYHRWPQEATAAIPGYVTAGGINMRELPGKQFNWNNMDNTAIAQLMLYCGQSVRTEYDLVGSTAESYAVPAALKDIFGYSQRTTCAARVNYSDEEWEEMVYGELQKGHPVLYFGYAPLDGGHAFVVDGYDDGLYHLNWGWNGYCDGYFTLNGLNPFDREGFNYTQEMILNVCPPSADDDEPSTPDDDEPAEAEGNFITVKSMNCADRMFSRNNVGETFMPFRVEAECDATFPDQTDINIGLALYNDKGMVKVIAESEGWIDNYFWGCGFGIFLDANLPLGEYQIKTIYRTNDTEKWTMAKGSEEFYVAISVEETTLRVQPMPKSWEDEHTIHYGTHTIDGVTYRLFNIYQSDRAEVLAYNNYDSENEVGENYRGDIYIPDSVDYQGIKFPVTSVFWGAFQCAQLTSLSVCNNVNGSFYVWACPNLTKLEMREGGRKSVTVIECPSLESLTYPESCEEAVLPLGCEKLSNITFKSKERMILKECDMWILPDQTILSKETNPALRDIYFASVTPPVIAEGCGVPNVNSNITIHIPKGTLPVYQRSIFKGWNLVDDQPQPAESDAVNWDYCGLDKKTSSGILCCLGINDVEFAMRIPAEQLKAYIGCRIPAIEFYTVNIYNDDPHWADVEYVFITSPGHDYLVKQTVNTVRGRWMNVTLSEPYTITGEELFVGVGRHSALQMDWANETIEPDGLWLRSMGEDPNVFSGVWEQNAGIYDWNHPLPIRAIIEGEHLPNDVVIRNARIVIDDEEASYAKAPKGARAADDTQSIAAVPEEGGIFTLERKENGKFYAPEPKAKVKSRAAAESGRTLEFKIVNRSPRLVENVIIDWTIDGKKQEPLAIETALFTNKEDMVNVPLPDDLLGYHHELNMEIASIDGEQDEIPANSNTSLAYTSASALYYPRKMVMEEGTGTWCGWCPSGIETIKYMKENYPDNFIAIAVHRGDELSIRDGSYRPFEALSSTVPCALINRVEMIDPMPFDFDDVKDKAVATIKAEVKSVDGNKVTIATETEFGFNDYGTDFRIAYVVTEDNVGPYAQCNFYSGSPYNPNDLTCWWSQQAGYVEMLYDEVARGIYDYYGVPGLLPTIVKMGEKYNSEYTLTLPDNVQNAHNANIVTLLLDTRSGEIMNADCVPLADFIPDGIQDILHVTDTNQDIYSITGVKIGSMTDAQKNNLKGIYIRNGKKVLVK